MPEEVPFTVIDFLTTALVHEPRPGGEPWHGVLVGLWSARRWTYRIREDHRLTHRWIRFSPP